MNRLPIRCWHVALPAPGTAVPRAQVTAVTECFSASPPVYSTTTAQRWQRFFSHRSGSSLVFWKWWCSKIVVPQKHGQHLEKKWYIFLILQPLRFLRLTRPCFSPFWWMEFIFGESHVGRRKSNKQRSLRPTGSVGVKGFFKLSHKKDTNVDELWVIWNYTTWVLVFFWTNPDLNRKAYCINQLVFHEMGKRGIFNASAVMFMGRCPIWRGSTWINIHLFTSWDVIFPCSFSAK